MSASKSISKTLVWVLMGLLILGLGGFGITNLSGTVRSVGSVGDAEIDINDYARALQNEIRALESERGEPISFAQAEAQGIPDAVLTRLVAQAALTHETGRVQLSVGDENLREQIVAIPGFQGVDGTFDREAYAFALEQAGLSEAQFEQDLRNETASAFLQGAVMAGVTMPEAYTDTLLTYVGEERDVTWAALDRNDLTTGLPEPTEEELQAFHDANVAQFTTPETREITYAWLTPEMIIDTVEVDEEALRDAYDARADEFIQPERRLVERLVFPDEAAAQAAADRIETGASSFEDEVTARDLDLSDVDMGDVTRNDLDDAAEDVFSADTGDVVGPADSPVGPALYRVNAILAAQETTFEEAEPQLRDALAGDRARRVIEAQIDSIDDLLAGGATIEDLARETDLELGTIAWNPRVTDGIGAYAGFRQAAQTLTTADYPEVQELEDGGIYAMRLDKVVAPEVQPLDEVRNAATRGWRQEAVTKALEAEYEEARKALADGTSFDDLDLSTQSAEGVTRRGFQPDTPANFIETVFEMDKGEVRFLPGTGRLFLLRVDAIRAPDPEDEDLAQLTTLLRDQAASGMGQDLFQLLANDIRSRAGIELNQGALNAVHSNFQ
ncbi:peptidylprolyl isomerase [Roseovarius sp. A21]|uniref:Parvulin-like PPIase n=1 Tax=Roseovarius bejariae TaxID=2576383 RepID=A0A844CYW4_9RHOB|nr:peptidyl-prolyl cis-trans isomerase [Roseovarius bejariae]MRU14028.1 peptidylprolyl isomerase [Roseovarius bejariae]